ncbi:uncharacterized protein LOC134634783 [Pelmatolapia mariae]|uniref:uncharacterized protein LOC134634783 n=1 Tax=Pelmatolapia mariae TaxID=158779 RepID=UPI002FE6BFED
MASSSNNTAGTNNQEQRKREMLQRLLHKVSQVMHRQPLDVDYLQFVIDHEMVLLRSLSDQVEIPQSIINALIELSTVLSMEDVNEQTPSQTSVSEGKLGRPNYNVSPVQLQILTEMFLSITQIAKLLGISVRTVKRRLHEYGISIKQCYSTTSDEELDNLVRSIKTRTPHVGYRMMKGMLQAMGHHVQWKRVYSSMHRVDSAGIFSKMTRLGFVVRRTYSVQGPLYLMHIDTNHKLIRFGLVIFGGIDGYSRKSSRGSRGGKCWNSKMHVHYPGLWKRKLSVRQECSQPKNRALVARCVDGCFKRAL